MKNIDTNIVDFDQELSVYIKYSYLQVSQVSTLLDSLEGALHSLGKIFPPLEYNENGIPFLYHKPVFCVKSIETGGSISFKLYFSKENFQVRFNMESQEFEIRLPSWSASLIVLGALLLGGLNVAKVGLETYKLWGDVFGKDVPPGKIIEKLNDQNNQHSHELQIHLHKCHQVFISQNITYVEVNGKSLGTQRPHIKD